MGSSIETQIADMASKGVHVIRWWMFPYGGQRSGAITWSGDTPTGLNSRFYTDMDNAIALADKYNIYLVPVFFSFDITKTGTGYDEKSGLFDSGVNTQAMIDNVVNPIMQRYPNESRILS